MSTLDGPIWSKGSIALTCAARSHFKCTLNRERWVRDWDECYCSSQEEESGDEDGREKDRQSILEKLLPLCSQSAGSKAKK